MLLPGGQVSDEGIFALPEDPPFDIFDYAAGLVPQDQLDEIPDVMPLRDQNLYDLIGSTCVGVVYDSDISTNYQPLQGNLTGARLGLFTFTVLAVEVPHCLPEAGSSSSLYSLWVRVDPPADPTIGYQVEIHDHPADSIQVITAEYDGHMLTVEGETQFGSNALMTLSVDGSDAGCLLGVEPFLLEQPMSNVPKTNRYRFQLVTPTDLNGRRLKIATDHGGADNVFINGL